MPTVIRSEHDRQGACMRRRMAVMAVVLGFLVALLAVLVALHPGLVAG